MLTILLVKHVDTYRIHSDVESRGMLLQYTEHKPSHRGLSLCNSVTCLALHRYNRGLPLRSCGKRLASAIARESKEQILEIMRIHQ